MTTSHSAVIAIAQLVVDITSSSIEKKLWKCEKNEAKQKSFCLRSICEVEIDDSSTHEEDLPLL
jgi:hypothetical protein